MPAQGGSVHQHPLRAFEAELADRYRIERELGRGGMATVYLAHDLKHDRPVALKVLRPEIAAVLGTERFLREIRIAARLSHHNILPLYDSAAAAGMLFYVMPFVEGGTLMERLARGPRPSVAEALGITRQIAEGLAYAHMFDVIHRDIKPANILMASGHVFIADFGIARAIRRAVTQDGVTSSGFVLGTPSYMAPEQLTGAGQIDGRADEYSLACVLCEMLLGHPPSRGSQGPSSLRRAMHQVRPEVPAAVGAALEHALSPEPSERFPGAAEFAAALDTAAAGDMPSLGESGGRATRVSRAMALGVGATILLLTLWAIAGPGRRSRTIGDVPLDTSRYAVLPFEYQAGIDQSVNLDLFLQDALSRWDGLKTSGSFQVREALSRQGADRISVAGATGIATGLGAGRYFLGDVTRGAADSLRVHVALYDVSEGQLGDHTIRLPVSLAGADSLFATLADALLFRGIPPPGNPAFSGSRSLPARQAFARGQSVLQTWQLSGADSAFAAAVDYDNGYSRASLWLALVRWWNNSDPATWRYSAEQAAAVPEQLSEREQRISSAILAQAREDTPSACNQWAGLKNHDPGDFVAWYGWAQCLATDRAVVRDSRSPSGWRFRSSYHSALLGYQRAFQLLPSILSAHRSDSYRSLRSLLRTSEWEIHQGHAIHPDSIRFDAFPAWQGDSLVYIPWPANHGTASDSHPMPESQGEAARHQRELFHRIALAWRSSSPTSADALQALALSLELLGDPSALDTLQAARKLVQDRGEHLRVAGVEVWLRIKFALPDDTASLRSARLLADSLLEEYPPGDSDDPNLLASLAAVTGRALLAAEYSRDLRTPPSSLIRTGPSLIAFASLGGPADSLAVLEGVVTGIIERSVPADDRANVWAEWTARASTLAFPEFTFQALREPPEGEDYLFDIIAMWLAGDTADTRISLDDLQDARSRLDPADITLDEIYPEASLLYLMGDPSAALEFLDPTLSGLRRTSQFVLASPARAGALVRAAILRAKLARALGDTLGAAQWDNAVEILWSEADPFLRRKR